MTARETDAARASVTGSVVVFALSLCVLAIAWQHPTAAVLLIGTLLTFSAAVGILVVVVTLAGGTGGGRR